MAEVIRPAWMTDDMWDAWLGYYIEAGGPEVGGSRERALELFREDSRYGTVWLPGITRDDGTIRYQDTQFPELVYQENIAGFRNVVEGLQMNADIFTEEYIDLIEGDVSVSEFTSRANALEERVMSQGPGIREWYSQNVGVDLTREGMLAALMSERVESAIFNRQLTMAEIGGTGIQRGFDISAEFVELLAQEGMDRAEAQRQFGAAERLVPLLGALARRQGDSTEWNIESFIETTFMDDPEGMAALDRMAAAEESTFTGGAQAELQRNNRLGLTGLAAN